MRDRGEKILGMMIGVILAAAAPAAFAQGGSFDGRFQGPAGLVLTLSQNGTTVTGNLLTPNGSVSVQGTVQGGVLQGTAAFPAGPLPFHAQASAESVDFRLPDGRVYRYLRQGGGAAVVPGAGAVAASALPERKIARARGGAYRSKEDGYSLRAPSGFAVSEDGGRVFLRGEGLTIAAQFHADLRYEAMEAYCERAAQLAGAGFGRVGEPARWQAGAGRAIGLDLSGPPALPVQARAVGIAGPRGALVVLGWTSPGAAAGSIGQLVDSVAGSVRFFKPKAGARNPALFGTWWTGGGKTLRSPYSKNRSHRSHERRVALCPNGRFHVFSQSDVTIVLDKHIDTGGGAQASNHYGRWSASGSASGTVTMRFDDGRSLKMPYQLYGGTGDFGGVRYGRDRSRNDCGF